MNYEIEIKPDRTTVIAVPKTKSLVARFLAKVEKTDDCWLWRGRVNPNGLGQFRIRPKSRGGQGGTRIDVHRLAHIWWKGPVPDSYEVDHTCRVSICVNPDHLEAITPEVNRARAQRWRVRDKLRAELLRRCRELARIRRERRRVAIAK